VASHNVRIKPSAVNELEAIPAKDRRRIATRIQALAGNPRPVGFERLAGHDKSRIRQDNCRVLYTIEDDVLIVAVIAIGNRRDIYRR
jgi:mRNA interferase RelE/StbE